MLGFVLLVVTVFSPLNQKPCVKYLSQGNNWQHSRIMHPFPETQVANPWSHSTEVTVVTQCLWGGLSGSVLWETGSVLDLLSGGACFLLTFLFLMIPSLGKLIGRADMS